MKSFDGFLREMAGNSWLVALVMNGRVVDLNVVSGVNEQDAVQRAVKYVLPQYKSSVRPAIVTVYDFAKKWRHDFNVDRMANGTDDEREAFLHKWFPEFRW